MLYVLCALCSVKVVIMYKMFLLKGDIWSPRFRSIQVGLTVSRDIFSASAIEVNDDVRHNSSPVLMKEQLNYESALHQRSPIDHS